MTKQFVVASATGEKKSSELARFHSLLSVAYMEMGIAKAQQKPYPQTVHGAAALLRKIKGL